MLKWFNKIFGATSAPPTLLSHAEISAVQQNWHKMPVEVRDSFIRMYESQTSPAAAYEFLATLPGPNGKLPPFISNMTDAPSNMVFGPPIPPKPPGLFAELYRGEAQTSLPPSPGVASPIPAAESQGTTGFVKQMVTAIDAQRPLNAAQSAHPQSISDAIHVD
ncbi:hypothetical protein FHS85_005069 [Rhodoligotrophos appendicifer]|uniref:hypothetical protein n=1 Tax=Rhodoligotrophos appendicifer TaxID=987056 RepID=UPI001186880A|nr:hypothetical protein [Rhodoligotrophos appendicifer]